MRYQKIESRIWFDEKFRVLTKDQKMLFFYILTCPHGNLIGLFVLPIGYISEDLKSLPKDLRKDIKILQEAHLIEYDEDTAVLWVKNFLKHNQVTNPNQRIAALSILKELPKSPLLFKFVSACEGLNKALYEGLSEGLSKPDSDSDSYLTTSCVTPPESPGAESKNGNVPYLEIQTAFNEICGEFLPNCNALTESRKKAIKQRFNTDEKTKTVEWWRDKFFTMITESEFLTGRNGKWTGCNFDWILKPSNFQKIREGTYNR